MNMDDKEFVEAFVKRLEALIDAKIADASPRSDDTDAMRLLNARSELVQFLMRKE